jgi:hypothetical protein
MRRIRTNQFVLDGEAVLLGVGGISDFDGLYSGQLSVAGRFLYSSSLVVAAVQFRVFKWRRFIGER